MRIVALSNLHGHCPYEVELPKGDVLVLAGGILPLINQPPSILNMYQYLYYKCEMLPWIVKMSKKYSAVVGTWGFSDRLIYQQRYYRLHDILGFNLAFPENVYMITDGAVKLDGIKFYCSPWTEDSSGLAFNESAAGLLKYWDRIPSDTDVLITAEAPRYAVSSAVGCQHLYSRVQRHQKIKVHIFGHLHSNCSLITNGTKYVSPSFTKTSVKNSYIPNTEAIQYMDIK